MTLNDLLDLIEKIVKDMPAPVKLMLPALGIKFNAERVQKIVNHFRAKDEMTKMKISNFVCYLYNEIESVK